MQFPIALLALAAFLFITGMVGHGANVTGPMGLKIGLEGRVGPFPRVVFVVVGSGVALAALVTFVLALPEPGAPPDPTPVPSPIPTTATVSVLVGIRPQLGQVSENMKLIVDNRTAASWSADQQHPTETVALSLPPGPHSYQMQGTYSYVLPSGAVTQQQATGSGSFTVSDGARLAVNYVSATNQFELVRTS